MKILREEPSHFHSKFSGAECEMDGVFVEHWEVAQKKIPLVSHDAFMNIYHIHFGYHWGGEDRIKKRKPKLPFR